MLRISIKMLPISVKTCINHIIKEKVKIYFEWNFKIKTNLIRDISSREKIIRNYNETIINKIMHAPS